MLVINSKYAATNYRRVYFYTIRMLPVDKPNLTKSLLLGAPHYPDSIPLECPSPYHVIDNQRQDYPIRREFHGHRRRGIGYRLGH